MSKLSESLRICAAHPDCEGCAHQGEAGDLCSIQLMRAAAEELDRTNEMLNAAMDKLCGAKKHYLYFCTERPPKAGELPEDGLIAWAAHEKRQYVPLIDGMAWGMAIYSRRLEVWEVMRYGLTSEPVDKP